MSNGKALKTGLKALTGVIILIGVICVIGIFANTTGDKESYVDGMNNYGSFLNGAYGLTLVSIVLCTLAAVGFGIAFFLMNIKNRKGSLIGFIAFVVLGLVSVYGLASAELIPDLVGTKVEGADDPVVSRWSGGGIIFTYILAAVAVGTIIWAEVSKLFK